MKIGILTMNYRCNYGGILQCLALRRIIEELGYEVEVIRFLALDERRYIRKLKLLIAGISFSIFVKYMYDKLVDGVKLCLGIQRPLSDDLLKRCKLFIDENIKYTEVCNENTIGQLVQNYNLDVVVIGSDKIWGELAREKLVYMGDFDPPFRGKLITYAACTSFPFIPLFNRDKIHRLLKRFYAISVRDTYTQNLFKCYPDIKMEIVLDPTFLYDFKPYLNKVEGAPYVLTYILGREIKGGHKKMIELIRQKYRNMKIKAIVLSNESMDIVPYVDEVIDDAGPSDWLNAIYNASFIYTDSFHGVVFSMKFQKPFIAYYSEISRSSRLIDLRDRFRLYGAVVSSVYEAINKRSIELSLDYEKINIQINNMKNNSLSYLKNNL